MEEKIDFWIRYGDPVIIAISIGSGIDGARRARVFCEGEEEGKGGIQGEGGGKWVGRMEKKRRFGRDGIWIRGWLRYPFPLIDNSFRRSSL